MSELTRLILERLRPVLPPPPRTPSGDPVAELVATILSQHTSDRNTERAFQRLMEYYGPDWDRISRAPVDELAETISCTGLSRVKAPRIRAVLQQVREQYGWDGIAGLRDLPVREARRRLVELPGVGPKTASCVLLFSLGRPALPVDTHVHRVSRRLGLIAPGVTADAAHEILESIVEPDDVYDFHMCVIQLGRTVCHARGPRCSACVLNDLCPARQ